MSASDPTVIFSFTLITAKRDLRFPLCFATHWKYPAGLKELSAGADWLLQTDRPVGNARYSSARFARYGVKKEDEVRHCVVLSPRRWVGLGLDIPEAMLR